MIKKMLTATILALAIFTLFASGAIAADKIGEKAISVMINNQGQNIGEAHYIQGNEGVLVEINVSALPMGKHGLHFHSKGTCEDTENFKMAEGHIMSSNKPHGFLNPDGPHEGNLPNLIVGTDGSAHVELYTELISVRGRDNKPALLDEDGSTLIVHANPDDHTTQPIGGSGARIACGVIRTQK
jgi:Cu-Zn family superoxide dismutase